MFDIETVHNLNALANKVEMTGIRIKTAGTAEEVFKLVQELENHGMELFKLWRKMP